jgi:hypothetical protein
MITRALSSATAGLAVTTGLLFVMQILIATGEEIVVEPRPGYVLNWVSPKDPPDTPVKERLPKKPDKPRSPPPTASSTSPGLLMAYGLGLRVYSNYSGSRWRNSVCERYRSQIIGGGLCRTFSSRRVYAMLAPSHKTKHIMQRYLGPGYGCLEAGRRLQHFYRRGTRLVMRATRSS